MAPTGAAIPKQGNQTRKAAGGGEISTDSFRLLAGELEMMKVPRHTNIDVSELEKQ